MKSLAEMNYAEMFEAVLKVIAKQDLTAEQAQRQADRLVAQIMAHRRDAALKRLSDAVEELRRL